MKVVISARPIQFGKNDWAIHFRTCETFCFFKKPFYHERTCSALLLLIFSLYSFILWLCCGVGNGGGSIVLMSLPSRSIRRWSREGSPPSGGGLWPLDSAEKDELVLVLLPSSKPKVTEYTRLWGPAVWPMCCWGGGYFGGVFVWNDKPFGWAFGYRGSQLKRPTWATKLSGTSTAISLVSSSNSTKIVLPEKWAESYKLVLKGINKTYY